MRNFSGAFGLVVAMGLLGVSSPAVAEQVRTTDKDGKTTVTQGGPSAAMVGDSQPLTVHVTRSVAAEIDALLAKHSFSRETSSLLVQLVHQGSGPFHGFKQSGGWCWNDDGTFYGSVPCPKKVKRSDVGRDKR